jgi:hypothetical protein
MRYGAHRDGAGDLAGAVAAHSVGHHEQSKIGDGSLARSASEQGEEGIFVVGAFDSGGL